MHLRYFKTRNPLKRSFLRESSSISINLNVIFLYKQLLMHRKIDSLIVFTFKFVIRYNPRFSPDCVWTKMSGCLFTTFTPPPPPLPPLSLSLSLWLSVSPSLSFSLSLSSLSLSLSLSLFPLSSSSFSSSYFCSPSSPSSLSLSLVFYFFFLSCLFFLLLFSFLLLFCFFFFFLHSPLQNPFLPFFLSLRFYIWYIIIISIHRTWLSLSLVRLIPLLNARYFMHLMHGWSASQ